MALQVRIINTTDPTDITILDKVDNLEYFKSINSSDEGVAFQISKNNPKSIILDPYTEASFTNIWEVWDTKLNRRLNYGPIGSIDDNDGSYRVIGPGRSALLQDHFRDLKTNFSSIDHIIEEIRYENLAQSPATKTVVTALDEDDLDDVAIFGSAWDEQYYGLSKRTKDAAIDEQISASLYWSGMTDNDTLAIDLGDTYPISKVRLLFPWWGGPQRVNNRSYEFHLKYSDDAVQDYLVNDTAWSTPVSLFNTSTFEDGVNKIVNYPSNPLDFYLGTSTAEYGTNINTFHVAQDVLGPVDMRYLIVDINAVHAWYGTIFDKQASHDGFEYQCDPAYRPGDDSYFGSKLGLMTSKNSAGTIKEKVIPDTNLKPENDCHAAVVEVGIFQEIVERKSIKPLALQRIDNNNKQIKWNHYPLASETKKTTVSGINYRKFEPGALFRKLRVAWTGASNTYTRFFKSDCIDCYPDGFSFGVIDDDNTVILMSDEVDHVDGDVYVGDYGDGRTHIQGRAYTKHVILRGSPNGTVTWVDCWRAKSDTLSWGGSYSYSEIEGDDFSVHFKGESFRWYGTAPAGKTGARVKIEIRNKVDGSRKGFDATNDVLWTSYTTLEEDYQLPDGPYNAQVLYEIPYENSPLTYDTVYEIRVTLLDSGWAGVDSIEGYWYGSMTSYGEDNPRISISDRQAIKQIYDQRFSGGSMYKWNKPGVTASLSFEGDRIIVYSAKGRHHGHLTIMLHEYIEGWDDYDPGTDQHIFIPGGNADGSITLNLDTGKRGAEIPQYVLFDSDDYFGPTALPWQKYHVTIRYLKSTAQKYTTTRNSTGSDSFHKRCRSCDPNYGNEVSVYEWVYLDGIEVHERVGLSVDFKQETHLEILKSVAEAIQVEWDVSESGLKLEPRLGRDTDEVLREGENTLVSYTITNDVTKVATRLLSSGSDIDGLALTTFVEDAQSRRLFGRTITRQHDFRDIADYTQLIGLGRTELKRRNTPEKRIIVSHNADSLDLEAGDSFILWTKKSGNIRVRINRKGIKESSNSGRAYELECIRWPQTT